MLYLRSQYSSLLQFSPSLPTFLQVHLSGQTCSVLHHGRVQDHISRRNKIATPLRLKPQPNPKIVRHHTIQMKKRPLTDHIKTEPTHPSNTMCTIPWLNYAGCGHKWQQHKVLCDCHLRFRCRLHHVYDNAPEGDRVCPGCQETLRECVAALFKKIEEKNRRWP